MAYVSQYPPPAQPQQAYAPPPYAQPMYAPPPAAAPPPPALAPAPAVAPAPVSNINVSPQIINQAPAASPPVVVVNSSGQGSGTREQYPPGSCRYCGGEYENHFTCCGIAWCILCFPIGIICLFTERERRCSACQRRA